MPRKVYSLQSSVYRGSQKSARLAKPRQRRAKREVGRHKKGFTLVELLIVISIIAMLSVVGLVSYTNFLKNSRDAKRQSDIKFIQSSLEQYFADQKHYPFEVTPGSPLSFGSRTYMTKVPSDPSGTPAYSYQARGSNCVESTPQYCNNYCLFVRLEGTALNSDPGCTPTGDYTYGIAKP